MPGAETGPIAEQGGRRPAPGTPEQSARPAPGVPEQPARLLRAAAIGVSTAPICGVRDHEQRLSRALREERCQCSTHWLDRERASLAGARSEIGGWAERLPRELAAARAEVALLHYSVFAYSYRGLPLFVRPVLRAIERAGLPLVTILHEFVYPWGRDGVRGATWAVSQRALLIEVMRRSDAVLTTTDFQADWLASRRWLAKRPTGVAPVFSNLPAASEAGGALDGDGDRGEEIATIGLFGYAYGARTVALIVEALRRLQDRGLDARLQLLGAPGRSSPAAAEWLALARRAGLSREPSLSGTLPSQQLADALAACDVLLFVDPIGPNSRKTTLAASLASGRPVLALDGPRRFGELAQAGAAEIVAPDAAAVAGALATLLADESRRERLGARGREFARQSMSAERAARTVARLLREVAG
jgi:glycosyltransferase involved in cell wall biosynthesis